MLEGAGRQAEARRTVARHHEQGLASGAALQRPRSEREAGLLCTAGAANADQGPTTPDHRGSGGASTSPGVGSDGV